MGVDRHGEELLECLTLAGTQMEDGIDHQTLETCLEISKEVKLRKRCQVTEMLSGITNRLNSTMATTKFKTKLKVGIPK